MAFHPRIGPISKELMTLLSSQEPCRPPSLLGFPLTLPVLSTIGKILPLQSPHTMLPSLFLNSKLFQAGTEPV